MKTRRSCSSWSRIKLPLLALGLGLLGVSCSSVHFQEFYITAIDTNEKEIVCAVYHDDKLVLNEKNEPVLTPARVKIPFRDKEQAEKIGVRAIEIDPEKKTIRGLEEGESSPYLEDARPVYVWDSRRQLFILRKNKSSG